MNSRRVLERLKRNDALERSGEIARDMVRLIRADNSGRPITGSLDEALVCQQLLVEVPENIDGIQKSDLPLAKEWRVATRRALKEAVGAGFLVTEFCRRTRGGEGPGAYLLRRTNLDEFVS